MARYVDGFLLSVPRRKLAAHRNAVNKHVMADPRLQTDPAAMPFDHQRMSWAGFKTLVDL